MRFRWVGLLVAIAGVVAVIYIYRPPAPAPPTTQTAATTRATQPATTQAAEPPRRWFDVVEIDHPAVATTQPLGVPLDLGDAARIVTTRPVYLDESGDLWVTHPQAPSVDAELKRMDRRDYKGDGTHATAEVVRFVYWMNDAGKITPAVFVENAAGQVEIATRKGRIPLPQQRPFHFDRVLSMRDRMAIPCEDGISVLVIENNAVTEAFVPLQASKDPLTAPQVVHGAKGLLAWAPASLAKPGGGVARYVDGKWSTLDEAQWPTSIVQLSPFLDGTVQQIRYVGGKLELASVLLDAEPVDEKVVLELIDKLGDLAEPVRDKAFRDLQRIGPAAWPIAARVKDEQLPEVQHRLSTLLKSVEGPAIGTMTPVDGRMRVIARFKNAGILLYGDAGVNIPRPGELGPATVQPAWICVRPDAGPELLNEFLVRDLRPGSADLIPVHNEWIVSDPIQGPRRFIGNAFLPLLRKSEFAFGHPAGQDRRGRTLFRMPGKDSPTLIIDPTLPDPNPRLPVWTIRVKNGSAGWTSEGWPAIKRGSPWELREAGWRAVDEKTTKYLTELPPATSPTTQTTQPVDPNLGPLLLIDREGNRYYGGTESLTIVTSTGNLTWPLPTNAVGKEPVTLLQTPDGKLFLFNQPGRVLRLSKTGTSREPFKLEATFSRNIPTIDSPTRLWVDPAGRICMVYDTSVSVMFPSGRIPREIATRMSLEEQRANEPE